MEDIETELRETISLSTIVAEYCEHNVETCEELGYIMVVLKLITEKLNKISNSLDNLYK